MTVVIKFSTGESQLLDRSLRTDQVVETVNEARGKGKLISFQNNETPSRTIWVDPDHVIRILNDGYSY